ncbi:hypothetical protein VOLCADRAFT_88060 [Volvox carteri f. nagariensis]|uniref:Uncharacterized protein n=1 Tax=Volvox carteri f. nagariensis TaxID=3068 RepID=D8TMY8_VOLCA|nr:uncharacterized protein VOLCADRAFT_88060 [Volvox carteri f. nagariensis]EFJ51209.1 hypothetical protein VOLCADRAFT_88060 [Volvox carteri f. nagariensis]|eukprot:XP_002947676.1 hypothetical protein VOLCADRAFT_88060 [Volvox carteri f. nagariensis]
MSFAEVRRELSKLKLPASKIPEYAHVWDKPHPCALASHKQRGKKNTEEARGVALPEAGQGASAIDDEDEDNSMDELKPVDSDAEPSIVAEPSTARNPAGLREMQLREGGATYERATAAGDGRVGMGAESRGCFVSTRRMLNNTSWDERLVPIDLETTMGSLLNFLGEPVTAWMNAPQHLFRRRQTTYINVCNALGAQPHPSLRSQYNSLREQTKKVADRYRGEAAAFRQQHEDIMKVQQKLLSAAEELQGEMDALWSAAAVREQSAAQLEQKEKFDAHQLFRQQYELGTSFTLESRDVEPFAPAFFTTDVVNARTLLEPADQPGAAITVADAPDLAKDRVACRCAQVMDELIGVAKPMGFIDRTPPPTPNPSKTRGLGNTVDGSSAAKAAEALDAAVDCHGEDNGIGQVAAHDGCAAAVLLESASLPCSCITIRRW